MNARTVELPADVMSVSRRKQSLSSASSFLAVRSSPLRFPLPSHERTLDLFLSPARTCEAVSGILMSGQYIHNLSSIECGLTIVATRVQSQAKQRVPK